MTTEQAAIECEVATVQEQASKSPCLDAAMESIKRDKLIKTATDMRVVEVSEALAPAYAKASTLELTDEEVAALMAPFPDSAVDIRPHDGLIFLSHIHISDRLNAVLKPGKWAMVCRRHWLENGTLYGEYILLIRGVFVGESVGGHLYQPNNPKTNYSDSLESTAAEALRRIAGKRLSCGSQVWHKDYAERWVATYAEQKAGKWRKKIIGDTLPNAAAGYAAQQTSPQADSRRPDAPKAPTPPPAIKTPAITPADAARAQGLAVASAKPMTPEERRYALIERLKGYEAEATAIFTEEALILEGENYTDISVGKVECIPPDSMVALIKQVRQRKWDNEQVPGEEVAEATPPADAVEGTVEDTNAKAGTGKTGKPFTKFGIKIDGVWHNTFSRTLFEAAMNLKGQRVLYTAQTGQFGSDITGLGPTEIIP